MAGNGLQSYDGDRLRLPVWLGGNVFYNQAKASDKDKDSHIATAHNPDVRIVQEGGDTFLHFSLDPDYPSHKVKMINTVTLGKAKVPKALFDAPDGSAIVFDVDYFGKKRDGANLFSGPFSDLKQGKNVLKVW
jgi:hypothetical protein